MAKLGMGEPSKFPYTIHMAYSRTKDWGYNDYISIEKLIKSSKKNLSSKQFELVKGSIKLKYVKGLIIAQTH